MAVEKYVKGLVVEENSPEIVNFITQLVLSFFSVREKERITRFEKENMG